MDNSEQIAFTLILHSGNGRSYAFEAIRAARQKDYEKAEELLEQARNEFNEAHNIQTGLLTMEAEGNNNTVNLLLVHAQDHLMTGLTVKELAEEIIELRKDIEKEIKER